MTGNEMFEEVKEECERIVEKIKGKGKKRQNGVLFFINRNRIMGWYEDGDEGKDGKYVGKWKGGSPWIGTKYNRNGKILGKWINGKFQ